MLKELYTQIQADAHAQRIDGFYTRPLHRSPALALPEALRVQTLAGIVDFVTANIDTLVTADLLLHVAGPTRVSLCGLLNVDQKRPHYCVAEAVVADEFGYGQYHDHENLIIYLMSYCAHSEDREKLIKLLGNLESGTITTHVDDGMTQQVILRQGIQRKANVDAPALARLRPYRTFAEIEQPESLFFVRMRSQQNSAPQAGLWIVKDNRWQVEAIAHIAAFLRDKVGDIPVIA